VEGFFTIAINTNGLYTFKDEQIKYDIEINVSIGLDIKMTLSLE
jgi:hypothetical protein